MQAIPSGSQLELVDGNGNKLISCPLQMNAAVGSCFEIEVQFDAPMLVGHYFYGF